MRLDDIEPITTLKRQASELIDRAQESRTPIVITQNGRARAVLQDVESFERDRRAFALLKLASEGEREIQNDQGMTYTEHRKRMKALLNMLRDE